MPKRFDLDFALSPVLSLEKAAPLRSTVERLRSDLARDNPMLQSGLLETDGAKEVFSRYWFQRIDIPSLGITTTSDHSRIVGALDGKLHTLFSNLSEREALLLRPRGKWDYIKAVLPDLRERTVLEIGSASGYFCFKFAELGSRKVDGIEVWKNQVDNSSWLASKLGFEKKVRFHCGDAYYDDIERHDVVFLSEVLAHAITPMHALLRIVGLAREFVILDEFVMRDQSGISKLQLVGEGATGSVSYTAISISENMVLTVCYLAGVPLENVQRYRDDRAGAAEHTTFVIDVRNAEARRSQVLGSSQPRSNVEYALGIRRPQRIES